MGQAISAGGTLRPPADERDASRSFLLPASSSRGPPAGCPMHRPPDVSGGGGGTSRSALEALVLQRQNNMPELPQSRAHHQTSVLARDREISSIPRFRLPGSTDTRTGQTCPVAAPDAAIMDPNRRWVYPSPQQFHNALVRKGKEAPEDSVEMMVNIHNWLNETAWMEIRRWEEWITGGDTPELASFQGRPDALSPKARWHLLLGKMMPDRYNTDPPFDRHDWNVWRPKTESQHRYIIDYYSAPDDENGMPSFSLDVRPALDSPSAVYYRLQRWVADKRDVATDPARA